MAQPLVTFIVATYQRADALRATLRSVVLQRHGDWEAIVIGDCCGPETAAAIAEVNDSRIRYYNLPDRYGEQAGPNTAGLHIARTDYIVFLNHDDVLLPDHLSHALSAIEVSGATLFRSRFAVVRTVGTPASGPPLPVFSSLTPLNAFNGSIWRYDSLEPASAWVVSTEIARRVGPWRPSQSICRTPLRDWILRAEREGGRFVSGELVTGVRFLTHNVRSGIRYASASPELGAFVDTLTKRSVDEVRQDILDAVRQHSVGDGHARPASHWSRLRPLAAAFYDCVGLDVEPFIRVVRGQSNSDWLRKALKVRTGEAPPRAQNLAPFLADAEKWRVI